MDTVFDATIAPLVGQAGGLGVLLDLPGPALGALSFALVLLVGTGLLIWRPGAVDRAVDLTVEGTPLSIIYGVIAFGMVAFVGGYLITQLGQVATSAALLQVSVGLVGLAAVALGGFGYAVFGTWLTQVEGDRRPWPGVALGAALSAAPWAVLPPLGAALAWILLAAVGLGNATQDWIHSDQPTESELRG